MTAQVVEARRRTAMTPGGGTDPRPCHHLRVWSVREAAIVLGLGAWISSLFDDEHLDSTFEALVAAARSTSESERPPRNGDRVRSRATDAVRGWTEEVSDDIERREREGGPREVLAGAAERFAPTLTVVSRRGAGGPR